MPVPTEEILGKEIDGQWYLTQRQASQYLGIRPETFKSNVEPHLDAYKDALHPNRSKLYLRSDLDQFKQNRLRRSE